MSIIVNAPMPGTEIYVVRRSYLVNARGKWYRSKDPKNVELIKGHVNEITLFELDCGDDTAPVAWRGSAIMLNPENGSYIASDVPICALNIAYTEEEAQHLLEQYKKDGLVFDQYGLAFSGIEQEAEDMKKLLEDLNISDMEVVVRGESISAKDGEGNEYHDYALYRHVLYDLVPLDKGGHLIHTEGVNIDIPNLTAVVMTGLRRGVRVMYDGDIYARMSEHCQVSATSLRA